MDVNHQDKTESKLTATEDKSTPSSLSLQDQRGTDQLQNNQMEDTIKQLRDRGYKITEEYSNTGQLSKVSGEHPQRKTLWDWLQLLIIPLLIFFLGIGFTWVQNQTSLQIAKDNRAQDLQIAKDTQEEATLKAYLDDMTTLLLDKKLGSQAVADKVVSADAAVVARAKTLIVLRRLTDPRRKATVVQFLYGAHLIGYFSCDTCPEETVFLAGIRHVAPAVINLFGADLSGADLSGASLDGADLRDADLRDANLSSAGLFDADLSEAKLNFAHLIGAHLVDADLSFARLNGADLSFAHLDGADLFRADLSRAQNLTQQQLDQVHSCRDATLPQGLTCHHNQ